MEKKQLQQQGRLVLSGTTCGCQTCVRLANFSAVFVGIFLEFLQYDCNFTRSVHAVLLHKKYYLVCCFTAIFFLFRAHTFTLRPLVFD